MRKMGELKPILQVLSTLIKQVSTITSTHDDVKARQKIVKEMMWDSRETYLALLPLEIVACITRSVCVFEVRVRAACQMYDIVLKHKQTLYDCQPKIYKLVLNKLDDFILDDQRFLAYKLALQDVNDKIKTLERDLRDKGLLPKEEM
jgi:hypothetical protein